MRENYLVWDEGKGPDLVIEVTSKKTRRMDQGKKRVLYRDVLRVPEYILFDPFGDYLKPKLQGYRLVDGEYEAIRPVDGRLRSTLFEFAYEEVGETLRLYVPHAEPWLPTRAQAERQRAEAALALADRERQRAEAALVQVEIDRHRIEALEREVERLRRRFDGGE